MMRHNLLTITILTLFFYGCSNDDKIKLTEFETDSKRSFENIVPDSLDLTLIGIDSLKEILPTLSDVEKIKIYGHLSWNYIWSWPDSAIVYATEGLKLADKLELANQQIAFLFRLTNAFAQIGSFTIALEKGLRGLEIAKGLNDPDLITYSVAGIGSVYFYAEDYSNALPYFKDTKKDQSVFNANKKLYSGFLGETYFHLNNYDSALFYIRQAYELDLKDTNHWSVPYLYMGKLAEQRGHYSEALQFYKVSISWEVPAADYIKAHLSIANLFKKENRLDSGIYYSKLAYATSQNTSLYIYSFGAASLLKELYHVNNQTDSAYKYQEIMLLEQDRIFNREKLAQLQNLAFEEQQRQNEIKTTKKEFQYRLKMNALMGSSFTLLVVVLILYRSRRLKQKAQQKIERAYDQLKTAQSQLIQSEKMASLGELTAGIAHEIQNPLNFVNNFSEVNMELIEELKAERSKGKGERDEALEEEILNDLMENEQKIQHHGKRADGIVKGMLQHSRVSHGEKKLTDINTLCDEYLRLAYHGFRAKDKAFNAEFKTELDPNLPKIEVVPQDIGRVLLNLINNAFQAVAEVKKPELIVATKKLNDKIEISVKDNGSGIPAEIKDKIFQPFFTTKPTGQGTGLGLSLSYDIVKAHRGSIKVNSIKNKSTEFTITLPQEI